MYCTVSSEASGFDIVGKMASGGGESSENNQYIPPNEDETTVYQNTEGIVMLFIVRRHQCETQNERTSIFFMRLLMTGNDSKRNFDSSEVL